MIRNDYDELFREFFDISDTPTRKCIVALEDVEQDQLLTALSSKLYDMIVAKVDDINFGTIPRSRGDITKVDGFNNTLECLKIMRQIVEKYNENPESVDTVLTAISNIRDRKGLFMKSFAFNAELPMILYNTMVLAIEQSVSFLISVCITYIKDPASEGMEAALDKVAYNNTRDNVLYEQLVTFNTSCASGDVDKLIDTVIKNGNKVQEALNPEIGDMAIDNMGVSPFVSGGDDDLSAPAAGGEVDPNVTSVNGASDEGIKVGSQSVQEMIPVIPAIVSVAGAVAVALPVIKFLLKGFIPMLRNITYFLASIPVKLSDVLAIQAQFIEANAYKLQYSTNSGLSDEKRDKVVKRQNRVAEVMMKWANRLAIGNKKAEVDARKMAESDIKKAKIEDFKSDVSSELYSKSVLF